MQKKSNSLRDVIVVGFALFSMFFGAGNVVFPPYLGMEAGPQWLAGSENPVRVIPLDQPLSRRLGVAVKAMPAANSPARLFLSFLKRQYQNAR